jgi:hypothetical protein
MPRLRMSGAVLPLPHTPQFWSQGQRSWISQPCIWYSSRVLGITDHIIVEQQLLLTENLAILLVAFIERHFRRPTLQWITKASKASFTNHDTNFFFPAVKLCALEGLRMSQWFGIAWPNNACDPINYMRVEGTPWGCFRLKLGKICPNWLSLDTDSDGSTVQQEKVTGAALCVNRTKT